MLPATFCALLPRRVWIALARRLRFRGLYQRVQTFLGNGEDPTHDRLEVLKLWRRIEGWFLHTSPEAGLRFPRPCLFVSFRSASLLETPFCRSVHHTSNACQQS